MFDLHRILIKIVVYSLSLFYGWVVSLFLCYKLIKNGTNLFHTDVVESPKILFDPKYGRHGFASLKDQGVRLHYVENGDKKNPMVLLIHGFPDFWFSWRYQIPKLAEKYWVVAIDMRGYGDSESPSKVKSYSLKHLVDDARQLITTLGKESATVIGHDWGGAVAYGLAINYPEMVNKLVILNAPHPTAFRKLLTSSVKQFLMSWYMFFFQLPFLPEFYLRSNNLSALKKIYQKKDKKGCSDEELEAYKCTFSQPGAFTPPINYYRASLGKVYRDQEKSTNVTSPTLIVWGDKDLALSTELAKLSAKYIENSKVEIVEGAGHWVHHEQPDTVNKHIEDFLL